MQYAVLLRGINVGGINIKMADLKTTLTAAGHRDVRTVAASGNVVLSSTESPDVVKQSVERTLAEKFQYTAWVVVVPGDSLRRIIDNYPFDAAREGFHAYVVFSSALGSLEELVASRGALDPDVEQIGAGTDVVYWQVRKGNTVDSTFGKLCTKVRFKSTTTTRNLNTLMKLVQLIT